MCGIIGYAGTKDAKLVLVDGLSKLEYRGYDSCGIALADPHIQVFKDAVRVNKLANSLPICFSNLGIGHTRWATHGEPCQKNAHPHIDCSGRIAVVHNGVINNYQNLRKQLIKEGHIFRSETDTEVIPHLIEKYYQGNLASALTEAIKDIEGSYAIIAMVEGNANLAFARKDSPLVLGIGDGEHFIASDVTAILEYTDQVIYLENDDIGLVSQDFLTIIHHGEVVNRDVQRINWSAEQSHKHGYDHFMIKEIHEQPQIIRNMISEYLSTMKAPFDFRNLSGNARSILFLACGTSYHAALIGKYISERLTDISVKVELASEFNYFPNIQFVPLAVGITQSGETADTLKAMRKLKYAGSTVAAITNVYGSTASRIADHTIYLQAGPEISVAATKSFTAQLSARYCLSLLYSNIETREYNDLIKGFRQLPDLTQRALAMEDTIAAIAELISAYEYVVFIGRGINYAVAMEGALKLKEISYIHSEAYAAGEIKHGPFALLSRDTPVIAIITHDSSYEAMLTNIKEIKSRGAPVFAIVEENDETVADLVDYVIPVPQADDLFSPFTNTIAVQLLAYYSAKCRNCPIDFPRNLAKSVTVE